MDGRTRLCSIVQEELVLEQICHQEETAIDLMVNISSQVDGTLVRGEPFHRVRYRQSHVSLPMPTIAIGSAPVDSFCNLHGEQFLVSSCSISIA